MEVKDQQGSYMYDISIKLHVSSYFNHQRTTLHNKNE